MTVRRAAVPWLWPMLFAYTTILPTYTVICLQRKFGQGPCTLIVAYRMITRGDALNMY